MITLTAAIESEIKPIVVLNTFDLNGFIGAAWVLESLNVYVKGCLDHVFIFAFDQDTRGFQLPIVNDIKYSIITYENITHFEDKSIGRAVKVHEYINHIIYSWDNLLDRYNANRTMNSSESRLVLSLTMSNESIPVATQSFLQVFERMKISDEIMYDLMLLGKMIDR